MRIISGKLKGKRISLPKDNYTRPLRDLVKESIFNLIKHSNKFDCKIDGANVLDLFSGTGSFGIECISRNAEIVTFIENYKLALKVLKHNISSLKVNDKTHIIEKDCFNFFNSNHISDKKYNIIFADPPYKEKEINLIINFIKKNNFLDDNGILIIHRHKKDDVQLSRITY